MKNVLLIALLAAVLISCSKDADDDGNVKLLNSWLLIEQLIDPGNGSGVFVPVDSEKTIEFLANGTAVSNGTLCTMNSFTGTASTSTVNASDNYIIPDDCKSVELKLYYEIEGNYLILYYPCFEGCAQKFVKIEIYTH